MARTTTPSGTSPHTRCRRVELLFPDDVDMMDNDRETTMSVRTIFTATTAALLLALLTVKGDAQEIAGPFAALAGTGRAAAP